MTEDGFRLPPILRRVVLIGLVLIIGPTMAWSAIWFTRTYVVPSRVPVHRPAVIAAPAPVAAPIERAAIVSGTPSAGNQPFRLAAAGNEPLMVPAPSPAPAPDTTGSIARTEPIPLPRPKPRITVASARGPVPLPRPRPSAPE
jgi:hypothetical protein